MYIAKIRIKRSNKNGKQIFRYHGVVAAGCLSLFLATRRPSLRCVGAHCRPVTEPDIFEGSRLARGTWSVLSKKGKIKNIF
jgi:hypothetical protein